jgi:hypothetical protein
MSVTNDKEAELWKASFYGDLAAVRRLLEKGVDINAGEVCITYSYCS